MLLHADCLGCHDLQTASSVLVIVHFHHVRSFAFVYAVMHLLQVSGPVIVRHAHKLKTVAPYR